MEEVAVDCPCPLDSLQIFVKFASTNGGILHLKDDCRIDEHVMLYV
jgi:hypothetical protein